MSYIRGLQFKAHAAWGGATPACRVDKFQGMFLMHSLADGAGINYIFAVFDRAWLHGKRVKAFLRTVGSSGENLDFIIIRDGSYNRASPTDFPYKSGIASKGAGVLYAKSFSASAGDIIIDTGFLDLSAGLLDKCTLFIGNIDPSYSWSFQLYLKKIEIWGDGGLAAAYDLAAEPVIVERITLYNKYMNLLCADYGYIGWPYVDATWECSVQPEMEMFVREVDPELVREVEAGQVVEFLTPELTTELVYAPEVEVIPAMRLGGSIKKHIADSSVPIPGALITMKSGKEVKDVTSGFDGSFGPIDMPPGEVEVELELPANGLTENVVVSLNWETEGVGVAYGCLTPPHRAPILVASLNFGKSGGRARAIMKTLKRFTAVNPRIPALASIVKNVLDDYDVLVFTPDADVFSPSELKRILDNKIVKVMIACDDEAPNRAPVHMFKDIFYVVSNFSRAVNFADTLSPCAASWFSGLEIDTYYDHAPRGSDKVSGVTPWFWDSKKPSEFFGFKYFGKGFIIEVPHDGCWKTSEILDRYLSFWPCSPTTGFPYRRVFWFASPGPGLLPEGDGGAPLPLSYGQYGNVLEAAKALFGADNVICLWRNE